LIVPKEYCGWVSLFAFGDFPGVSLIQSAFTNGAH
jgi:hypothetical protein